MCCYWVKLVFIQIIRNHTYDVFYHYPELFLEAKNDVKMMLVTIVSGTFLSAALLFKFADGCRNSQHAFKPYHFNFRESTRHIFPL